MDKPLVCVVGRPNVGKSTFFNKVIGKRVSIVENTPGVTRDRIYQDAEWCGYHFTMVDTGGIELKSEDQMWQHIKEQAEIAVDLADVIVFMVDGKNGLTKDDVDVAAFLRTSKKPIVLTVNKVDNSDFSPIYEFYNLGIGEPFAISSEQSLGLGDLLDEIVKNFKDKVKEEEDSERIKVAVVGKPNAGKSSLVNKILGYDRTIVSDIAGTTRDAIDTPFDYQGQKYTLIDTAGIRKKSRVNEDIEYYSVIRAISAIRKADLVLIVVDSTEMLSEQDIKICGLAHDAKKPSVIVMNKWDLVEKDTHTINLFNKEISEKLKFMDYLITVYVSALTGQRLSNILDSAKKAYDNAARRVSTGVLNDVIEDAISVNEPPTKFGKRLKISYATQASASPPTFIFFVNDETIVHFSYKRYLENNIRKAFDFSGTPLKLIFRNKDSQKEI